jgi:8-hydroxy-5-deazaflavin:NADPH oxidoreductase
MMTASSRRSAEEKAPEIGAEPAPSNHEAVEQATVVVLAVWYAQHEEVAGQIGDVAQGKIVVDVSNPLTPDMERLATEGGPSAADAKQTVSNLVASIGLRPVDAGPLRHARHLEGMGFLGIYLNKTHGWGWNTAWKLVGP